MPGEPACTSPHQTPTPACHRPPCPPAPPPHARLQEMTVHGASWSTWSLVMCDSCPPPLWRDHLRLLMRLMAATGQPYPGETKLQMYQCYLIVRSRWGQGRQQAAATYGVAVAGAGAAVLGSGTHTCCAGIRDAHLLCWDQGRTPAPGLTCTGSASAGTARHSCDMLLLSCHTPACKQTSAAHSP
jgi:hypothetical protein